jgi:DNA-binding response OmpR family regulator
MNTEPTTAAPTVLVADDDPDLVVLIERRLVKDGYRVITACDGDEALHQAVQHVPQLAVLDVMMPKLSGVEVMERLHANPATQSIRVVLISAGFQENGVSGAVPAGADDYVKKPFGPGELPNRVRAVLERAPNVPDLVPPR